MIPPDVRAAIIARDALYLADKLHAGLRLKPGEQRRLTSLSPDVQRAVRAVQQDKSRNLPSALRPGAKPRKGLWLIILPSRTPGHGHILETIAREAGCTVRLLRRRMQDVESKLGLRKRGKGRRYS